MSTDSMILTKLRPIYNFLGFAKSYWKRHNPIKEFTNELVKMFKDLLSINKTAKMAKYRLNYQKYRLKKTEQIIAQSSEHLFLQGRVLNERR